MAWYGTIKRHLLHAAHLLAVAASAGSSAGCANMQPTQTGFLGHYDQIKVTQAGMSDPAFVKAGDWGRGYTGFMLDPVTYRPAPGTTAPDQDTVQMLTMDYGAKLAAVFSARLRPASAPGQGVLRIRAAVTDAKRANPVVNVITAAAIFVPVTTGGASTEAELLDSVTGERLAALTAFNNAGRSFLGGPFGFLSQYGHARRAFTVQAEKLRDLVPGNGPAALAAP